MIFKEIKVYLALIFIGLLFSYQVGDEVNSIDQNKVFEICYGHDLDLDGDGEIKLADFNGDLNGGHYNVILIDMSATWCGPCYSLIPYFDDVLEIWEGYDHFIGIVALSDLNQPYSCTQWGSLGDSGIPLIVDDSGYPMFSIFNTDNAFPSTIFIDHNMKVHYKEAGYSNSFVSDANALIEEMVYNMENSLIMSSSFNPNIINGDGDSIINPGETITLDIMVSNNSFNANSENITFSLYHEGSYDIEWQEQNINQPLDNLNVGENTIINATFTIPEELEELLNTNIILELTGEGYDEQFFYEINVSLDQDMLNPLNEIGQIKGVPVVVDDWMFTGDYLGAVRKYDIQGNEDSSGVFPYDIGDQIWGSLASSDIDLDGSTDIIVTSKSKHLVALSMGGEIQFDYDANSWLMGTPAIGQLDSDPELEIVVGGYSSSARNIYAVNHDGTDVSGFPVDVDERMIVGVALHDFNNNGKDDIVFGTDSDKIHLMHDDGTIVWSYETGDKIQSAPSIINTGSSVLICAGSKDDNMYCLDQNGQLVFSVETDGNVFSSPAAVSTDSGVGIFFGSEDGYIYGVNQSGNPLPGWPKDTGSNIIGSVSFSDLDNDGSAEVIANNEAGTIFAYHLDGTSIPYFPITGDFSYASSPQILDFDNDGDLEVFAGSSLGVEVFDVKTEGSNSGYWSTHRSNQARTGYIEVSNSSCTTADVNSDGIVDILDIVQTINIAMGFINPTDIQSCAADINGDSIVDVLDIVMMVNIVLGA